jgi:hypothetical protein
VRRLDQLARDLAVHTRHADVEARPQEVAAGGEVQIDLGIDRWRGRQLDLPLAGGDLDRADEAGRPSDGEELLGGRVRLRQLDVDKAVAATRCAVAAARGCAGRMTAASARDSRISSLAWRSGGAATRKWDRRRVMADDAGMTTKPICDSTCG